jgi:hypothetical protein
MPATPWPSSNRQVAHPFVTDTDEHHQNSVPPSFVRIHYSPYNSGAHPRRLRLATGWARMEGAVPIPRV